MSQIRLKMACMPRNRASRLGRQYLTPAYRYQLVQHHRRCGPWAPDGRSRILGHSRENIFSGKPSGLGILCRQRDDHGVIELVADVGKLKTSQCDKHRLLHGGAQGLGQFEGRNIVWPSPIEDPTGFHGSRIVSPTGYRALGVDSASVSVEKRTRVAGSHSPVQILSMGHRLGCDHAIDLAATARRNMPGNGEDVRWKCRHIGLAAIAATLLALRAGKGAGFGGRDFIDAMAILGRVDGGIGRGPRREPIGKAEGKRGDMLHSRRQRNAALFDFSQGPAQHLLALATLGPRGHSRLKLRISRWRPRRDSNPCYRRERAMSWASRRRGRMGTLGGHRPRAAMTSGPLP